jgi:hypothetical protein
MSALFRYRRVTPERHARRYARSGEEVTGTWRRSYLTAVSRKVWQLIWNCGHGIRHGVILPRAPGVRLAEVTGTAMRDGSLVAFVSADARGLA